MNLATYAINRQVVSWVLVTVTAVGGLICYDKLGKLEDPEFTIKEVPVMTSYPGATASEVENEVTELIETAVQRLGQVRRIRSLSEAGQSTVYVEIKPEYDKFALPQVWDELRRKVNDVQKDLPPGAGPSLVKDDFGDVFGVLYCVTGDGHSQQEIYDYVKYLRRELLQVKDVARIEFWGDPKDAVYVEMSSSRIAALGIAPQQIYRAIEEQGNVTYAGDVRVGSEQILFEPTGGTKSVEDIGNLLVSGKDARRPVYLKDVARVFREERQPPSQIARFNGERAVAMGISTVLGGNVVVMGDALLKRLKELEHMRPVGMELNAVAVQSEAVKASVSSFVKNVAGAFIIVVAILVLFMGFRSGVIIGIVLLLIVGGTLIGMQIMGIPMQRISLGALIVALGMLVDNAIVVCDGMLVRIQRGMDRKKAATEIVGQMSLPLLGATVVAILAFSGIGFSPDSTGEFCKSLFQVIFISLFLSWLFAVTVTPLLGIYMLKAGSTQGGDTDAYGGPVYKMLAAGLSLLLRMRYLTLAVLGGLVVVSFLMFTTLSIGFFPDMDRPQFVIEYTLPAGTYIDRTTADMQKLEKYILRLPGVTNVSTWIGKGTLRFLLTYTPEDPHSGYGMLLVTVENSKQMDGLIADVRAHMAEQFSDGDVKVWKFSLGPGGKAKVEARFSGPDPVVLRDLVNKAMGIMSDDGRTVGVRNDWRQRVKVIRAEYAATKAQAVGVTRSDLAAALAQAYRGTSVGLYREEDDLLPIMARAPLVERGSADSLGGLYIYSPAMQKAVPIGQVVSGFATVWEDQLIRRKNKLKTMIAQCDPISGPASKLLTRIGPPIENLPLPVGYSFSWGGDYEKSKEANEGMAKSVPLSFFVMGLILIFMFNNLRQPLAIVLSVPMAFMGLFFGFFIMSGITYDFIAIIATLSLVGMMIKNSIVICDQYNTDVAAGMKRYAALIHAAQAMSRPQLMAAFTTVLGVIPLLWDVFFKSLAVAIMFGLTMGALLALVVVPLVIAVLYRVKDTEV